MIDITAKFEALNDNKPFDLDDMAEFVRRAKAAGAPGSTKIEVGGNGDVYRAWVLIPQVPGFDDQPPF